MKNFVTAQIIPEPLPKIACGELREQYPPLRRSVICADCRRATPDREDILLPWFSYLTQQAPFRVIINEPELVLHPDRNRSCELPVTHHCVVKISSRWPHIAVEILPGTVTHQTVRNFTFCLDGALECV